MINKKILFFFGLLGWFTSPTVLADDHYEYFSGSIEHSGEIYASLVFTDTVVSGYLEIPNLFELPVWMAGTIIAGNIEISAEAGSMISFKGLYNGTTSLNGELHHNRAVYSVQLSRESCKQQQCMPFKVHKLDEVKLLGTGTDSPVAIFHATLLEAASPDGDNLNKTIQNRFFKITDLLPAKAVLPAAGSDFFSRYIERNTQLNTAENYSKLNWEQNRKMYVIYNRNHKISMAMHDYAYTGGEAGLKLTRFLVYDLINEREIRLNDLIPADALPELKRLISQKLRQDLGLPDDEPLNNHGYYHRDIETIDNFYWIENGLVFHYNPYEIASDKGETEILISWKQLNKMLK